MNLMQNWKLKKPIFAPTDEGAPAPDTGQTDAAPAGDTSSEPDFSFIPDQYRKDGAPDFEGFRAHYDELASAQAIRDEAMADVPEDAAGYEFAVPEELDLGEMELPEGFSVDLKADDPAMAPLFEELGGIMHKHSMPKGAANEVMGLLAKYEASRFSQNYAAAQSELEGLGASAQSRISDIDRVLQSKLPEEEANAIRAATTTAAGVKALERLLKPRGLTTATPTPPQNEPADPLAALFPNTP